MPTKRSNRLSKQELHKEFLSAVDNSLIKHTDPEKIPLEVDFEPPLPPKVRVYMFNVTNPPGGRPSDEYKSQLILPEQKRGERASFDHSDGRIVLLVGYSAQSEVFILWDAGLYHDFAYSRSVQVKGETVFKAIAGELGEQTRHLQAGTEVVVASNRKNLKDAIIRRNNLTVERLSGE
jgi:hypothetical protein